VLNRLRGRIRVQADGQMKTGRDVVIGALLGADEFGFATAPLVVEGCIMMRKCHLNTCPVGVATQDPVLRRKFSGKPEHVVNYFFFVAEEVRELMAQLGVRRFDELIGRVDLLDMRRASRTGRRAGSTSAACSMPDGAGRGAAPLRAAGPRPGKALDHKLIERCKPALERARRCSSWPIRNVNRSVGAMLSGELAPKYPRACPTTPSMQFKGTAARASAPSWRAASRSYLIGDANDYTGKGLSGGRIVGAPEHRVPRRRPDENIIIGNTALYGATAARPSSAAWPASASRCATVGRHRGGRRHRRPRLRVHDRRHRGRAGRPGATSPPACRGGVAYVYDEDGSSQRCNTSDGGAGEGAAARAAGSARPGKAGTAAEADETLLKRA
jgi:glutamate synthase (NADPH/NADH) large chain